MKLRILLLLLFFTFSLPFSGSAQFDEEKVDSPLMKAVRTNNLVLVKKLVAEGAEINEESDHGWNEVPVDVAVKNNFQAIALYLLENGATSRAGFYAAVEKGNLEFVKKLMEYGYRDGEAVLAAVESKNPALVEYLIAQNYPVNFSQKRRTGLFRKEYISPMDAAIYSGNAKIILILVKAEAPVDQAFAYACGLSDQQLGIQLLALKKELNSLHLIAVEKDNLALARKALQSGADPAYLNDDGNNVLHIAAMKGTQQGIDYAVNECKIPITTKNRKNENCLMLVAKSNNYNLFADLVKKGIFGLEETDQFGQTVLFHSVKSGNVESVNLLLDKKVNINHADNLGVTAVMLSLKNNHEDIYNLFTPYNINYALKDNNGVDLLGYYAAMLYVNFTGIEALINKGCDPKALDINGSNLAYHAVRADNIDFLNKLKSWNISIDPKDKTGHWPASYEVKEETILFVINNGGDPNRTSTNGDTYISTAFKDKNVQLFAALLRAGANPKSDGSYNTPMIFSLLNDEYIDYLKLLVQYGADVNAKNNWGRNVLEEAIKQENGSSEGVVKYLKTAGAKTQKEQAEFEVQRLKEMQSLPGMVQAEDLAQIIVLLNKYPDITLTRDQINKLIVPAIRQENLEFIELLFKQGLLPTALVNFQQQTLAHIAVIEGKPNLLKLFVNKGTDPFVADAYDKKPIDYTKNKEIKSYLKELAKTRK